MKGGFNQILRANPYNLICRISSMHISGLSINSSKWQGEIRSQILVQAFFRRLLLCSTEERERQRQRGKARELGAKWCGDAQHQPTASFLSDEDHRLDASHDGITTLRDTCKKVRYVRSTEYSRRRERDSERERSLYDDGNTFLLQSSDYRNRAFSPEMKGRSSPGITNLVCLFEFMPSEWNDFSCFLRENNCMKGVVMLSATR